MPIKYAPAHANWVGAPTKGNTVDAPHVYRHPLRAGEAQWRLAQYPYSGPLTTEGGRQGGREGRKKIQREREWENIHLQRCIRLYLQPNTGPPHSLSLWNWIGLRRLILFFFSFFFCKTIYTCGGDALRGNIFHHIRIPEAWRLTDMARGIESLVSLNPFCSMDSAQGGHNDNCKFWLLDLGRCRDHVFHMRILNHVWSRIFLFFPPSACRLKFLCMFARNVQIAFIFLAPQEWHHGGKKKIWKI